MDTKPPDPGPAATSERLAWMVAELVSSPATDPGALLDRGAEMLCETLADSCVVGVLFDDGARIHPLGLFHADPGRRAALDGPAGPAWAPVAGPLADLVAAGTPTPFTVGDDAPEHAWLGELADPGALGLALTMRALGSHVGVIALLRSARGDAFRDREIATAQLVADHLGLAVHALQLRDDLAGWTDAPGRRPDAADERLAALSERERWIFRSIGAGLSSREIASEIYLSVRTVEWHRARLMAKLGTTRRSELIALGRELRP